MTLALKVEAPNEARPDGLDEEGRIPLGDRLTIGRAEDNGLILQDPKRNVSKLHCVIERVENFYHLVDHSRNGTFLNRDTNPLPRGTAVALQSGDHIQVACFGLTVLDLDAPVDELVLPVEPEALPDDEPPRRVEHTLLGMVDGRSGDPSKFAASRRDDEQGALGSLFGHDPDPLDDFGPSKERGTFSDHVEVQNLAFVPPVASQESIPDDWDIVAELGGAAPPRREEPPVEELFEPDEPVPEPFDDVPPPAPPAAQATPVAPVSPPPSSAPASDDAAALAAFLAGAGLTREDLRGTDLTVAMERAGRALRLAVAGVHTMLSARGDAKTGFGAERTWIGQSGNNPLKFIADPHDAMRAMIAHQLPGFLAADEAIEFAFKDIEEHQIGLVGVFREALNTLVRQLDPETVAKKAAAPAGLARIMPAARRAQLWDAYRKTFEDVASGLDNDGRRVFGKDLAESYSREMNAARRGRGGDAGLPERQPGELKEPGDVE